LQRSSPPIWTNSRSCWLGRSITCNAPRSDQDDIRVSLGGSVYRRLSTRPIEQIKRTINSEIRNSIIDGAYWMRKPGPNCQAAVAYTGAVSPEALQAVGLMAEDRRDVGLLA
jgi:pyruvate dehydrogenase E1 component